MRRLIRSFVASAVLLGILAGLGMAGEASTARDAAARLREEYPQAKFHKAGQRITRVYGQPLAIGTDPEHTAERFRSAHAAVFGVEPADLKPAGLRSDKGHVQPVMLDRDTGEYRFTLVRYEQVKDGIPVFRSDLRLLVRNEPGYPLVLAASALRDLGGFWVATDFSHIRKGIGQPAALADVPGLTRFSEPTPVIWAGIGDTVVEPVSAVKFVGESSFPQEWLFVASATTGEILYKENLIIHTDVIGGVSGLATEGDGAEHCEAEVATAMPYAYVYISGGNSAYADENGDFVIQNSGSSPVTVLSPIQGQYFNVFNYTGADAELSQSITPPGPADFLHNPSNTESVRAQVNAYVEANLVRDLVLAHNPSYPSVSTETHFPVYVNRTDGYCPGNAWYSSSEQSINFCSGGGGYPNTAWSGVIHHEYGHRLVNAAGSGQGQYGEGMGDVMGLLLSDDPGCGGYGFFGPCNQPLRNADNTKQYPCSGGIHDCGQLISGCVWSTRNELVVSEPGSYLNILSNLSINSILLHSGSSITPSITIDFLTLDDDDGNIGNGTPHRAEICAGFGAHNMDCPPLDSGLSVSPTSSFEPEGDAGGPFTPPSMDYALDNIGTYSIDYTVTKSAPWLSLTNAAGTLSPSATTVVTVSINSTANSLPEGVYVDTINFINTTDHAGDATREVTLTVGVPDVVYEWTLDTDPGWSTQGLWAWGSPTGGGGQYGGPDPTGGYTGANVYGYNLNGDYENNLGLRHLTSTAIDCSGLSGVTLKFQRWLGVEQPAYDHAYVRVSSDATNWTTIWENGVEVTDGSWTLQEFDVSAVADDQSTVYLRWTMGTTDSLWQYCGWNIDDVQIVALEGGPECSVPADCDDGLFCNGAETCVAGSCQAGSPVNCDDGVGCTDDACNETTDSCESVSNDANCDDGEACTDDTCDASLDCQFTPNDANTCTDGVGCTDDVCVGGSCASAPNDANCDDGEACTDDTCDASLDCQFTPDDANACTDGVGCTDDVCVSGSCASAPNDANCDDGEACTDDTCDASLDCQFAPNDANTCTDGVGCTDDGCAGGSCASAPNDANCADDGLFCSGTEYCDPASDCSSTGDPCGVGESCNEATDSCDVATPTGEGYILSRNSDFSTDDRVFVRNETIYMKVWSDQVDFNDIKKAEWELKAGSRVKQPLTNHLDATYTASYDLSGLPNSATEWVWKGKVEDNSRTRFQATDAITVLDAPQCSTDADCDDGDSCTMDVCTAGSCANTPIDCSDGDPCTSDSCSDGVCFNDPLPTCCGDGSCDAQEDSCNCPADCGAPPSTETNCTDGLDEDCDGAADCADADCIADPACDVPTGEGYILSRNPDFSTDDRAFNRSETIYMKVWSDQVDYNNIKKAEWELKADRNRVKQPLANHFDATYTASFDLSGLPSSATEWVWKGKVEDRARNRFQPTDVITVLP